MGKQAKPITHAVVSHSDNAEDLAIALTSPEFSALRVVGNVKLKHRVREDELPGLLAALSEQSSAVLRGDMKQAQAMLINQAIALQSLFSRLTIRGMEQTHMQNFEGFMRLALRAQNQCRATLETLAIIKTPHPLVVARQANVSVGAPQQVNNHLAPAETRTEQNQLLEKTHGERLDTRTPTTAGRANPNLAPMGKGHRPKDVGG